MLQVRECEPEELEARLEECNADPEVHGASRYIFWFLLSAVVVVLLLHVGLSSLLPSPSPDLVLPPKVARFVKRRRFCSSRSAVQAGLRFCEQQLNSNVKSPLGWWVAAHHITRQKFSHSRAHDDE